MATHRVVAVIVAYFPDFTRLHELLTAVATQVKETVIVDNSASNSLVDWLNNTQFSHVSCLPQSSNLGVAAAQNIGIEWAIQQYADYVVLFDQDSCPAPTMINALLSAVEQLQQQQQRIAAVGPRYLDTRQNNPPPFIRIQGLKLQRCACDKLDSIVHVDYLIASGCLIPVTTLNATGLMLPELFIDYVDIEWGLRAKSLGFQSFGVCSAEMAHELGEKPIAFLGRQIPLHSPLRHYYHFRNAVWLYQQSYIPLNWKCVDASRLLLKLGFYSVFAKPRVKQFSMMVLGIGHGLLKRLGQMN
ncbi:glycosyltransferase family 2 protein [Methylocucumis oryzae]|uniref:Glycosyltransferase 2-like domain-containing protein n=1 Tax=Methylocucumis oryzae TaxID=1632867 RepID=A0A0F3IIC9_9GAMM|nr:glycosyltransferase family 2 protein [Methylocucumis oryzae]KJV05219.1 hypothetical protein VZ94_19875 [Methylocucumis oryzae]